MTEPAKKEGPFLYRVLIWVFSVVLSVLTYWLLGFVMEDIDTIPGPDYVSIEERRLNPADLHQEREIERQKAQLRVRQFDLREKLALLEERTSKSQQSLSQILEIQRVALQKGIKPSEIEQRAFLESQRLFIANQKQSLAGMDELAQLRAEEKSLQAQLAQVQSVLNRQRGRASQEYATLQARHKWFKAALKVIVLIPVALLCARLYLTKRASSYVTMIYAAGFAVFVKLLQLMHEYFPERYFKYILVCLAIGIVAQIIVQLVRTFLFPKKSWLLKQFREAYENFCCGVCGYPIRRGPLKYLRWGPRAFRKEQIQIPAGNLPDEVYACPACGTMLYENCPACRGVRHSLLPNCEKCGAVKEVASPIPSTG